MFHKYRYKYKLNPEYEYLQSELINIKKVFHNSDESIHKARNELKIVDLGGVESVVKAFKVPNIINQIVYSFFRDSKAKKSYLNSLRIEQFTPKPIAYIEYYTLGLLKKSYFISENFKYDFTIREPLLDDNFQDRQNIFKAFARFTLSLHNEGIFHNDYSPGNILIKKDENGYIFKIVDINRMNFYKLTQVDRAKNFSKLWAHDEILRTMAREYKLHYKCNEHFEEQVVKFSNDNKKVKNFKKRLKGKAID